MIRPTWASAVAVGELHVGLRVAVGAFGLRVVDAAPHVRGLVDAGEADEQAGPARVVLHDVERRVGRPQVAALVARLVADEVAVVLGEVQAGRLLVGVVGLVALDVVAGAALTGDVRRDVDAGGAAQAAVDPAGHGPGLRNSAGHAAEGDRRGRADAAEPVGGVRLGADGVDRARVVEIVGQLRVALVVLQREELAPAEVAGDVELFADVGALGGRCRWAARSRGRGNPRWSSPCAWAAGRRSARCGSPPSPSRCARGIPLGVST